jgi:hypothetical protein
VPNVIYCSLNARSVNGTHLGFAQTKIFHFKLFRSIKKRLAFFDSAHRVVKAGNVARIVSGVRSYLLQWLSHLIRSMLPCQRGPGRTSARLTLSKGSIRDGKPGNLSGKVAYSYNPITLADFFGNHCLPTLYRKRLTA